MVSREEPIALGPFHVDVAGTRLLRDGVKLNLRPRAFRALKVLVQNPGRLVPYKELIHAAWDGVNISNHTVNVTIAELKSVLKEYGAWITCRPKFGYCLEIPESEDLIRRGWHFLNQYTRAGFEHALTCFQRAAENDSADFRAFEAISRTYLMLAGFLMRAPRDIHGAFLQAHSRAVDLCGLTPELRLDRAIGLCIFEHKLVEAESELLAVHRERPASAQLCINLTQIYLAGERPEEARAVMQRAHADDSLAPQLAILGMVLRLFCREFDAAVEWGKNTMDLHPSPQVARAFYAEALDHAGRPAEALAQYRLATTISPDTHWLRADEGRCLARHGRSTEAWAILEDLQRIRETEYVDAFHVALLLDALGKREEAFQELERACNEGSYGMLFADLDAKADGFRSDPRFAHLRSRTAGVAAGS